MEIERYDNLFFNYSADKPDVFLQVAKYIYLLTVHNLQIGWSYVQDRSEKRCQLSNSRQKERQEW
jgi:hypothetical protein